MGIDGACASLRLKAYRRGEQDVEYIRLLSQKMGLLENDPFRRQVAALVRNAVKATRKFGRLDAEGAVTESLTGMTPDDFERLRQSAAERIE